MKLMVGAIVASVGVHILGASIGSAPETPTFDGGEVSGEIALGLGFADLVTGVATGTAVTPDATMTATPTKTASVAPPAKMTPVTKTATVPAVAPALPTAPTSKITATAQTLKPVAPEPTRVVAKTPPAPKPVEASRGNAKGQTTGTTSGRVAEASKTPAETTATKVGARAIKTYHAAIHRKISRVPKRSAGAKGDAFVGITIAGSGAIASVQIVKSSGHASIDTLALAQIKRAGPFAPTPNGAVMRVQVKFSSKS